MFRSNKRLEKFIKKYGFKLRKVAFRPDLLSMQFMNKHLSTIPKVMYSFPSPENKSMDGMQHPDYFDRENQAVAWNKKVKRTNFLEDDWSEERKFIAIRKQVEGSGNK